MTTETRTDYKTVYSNLAFHYVKVTGRDRLLVPVTLCGLDAESMKIHVGDHYAPVCGQCEWHKKNRKSR